MWKPIAGRTLVIGTTLAAGVSSAPAQCEERWCLPVEVRYTIETTRVFSMAVFDPGDGPRLYFSGHFDLVGERPAEHLGTWNGQRMAAVLPGANDRIFCLRVLNDGSGPELYAGGEFTQIGGINAPYAARYDGMNWTAVSSELVAHPSGFPTVMSFEVFDSGSGPELYLGGNFRFGLGINEHTIARQTPSGLSPLAQGLASTNPGTPWVGAMAVYDDGSGPGLFVGGTFVLGGSFTSPNVARWDGISWSAVGQGLSDSPGGAQTVPTVTDFQPWETEKGTVLLVAGDFFTSDGQGIAQWDGVSWSHLNRARFRPNGARTIHTVDLGLGQELIVGGTFDTLMGNGFLHPEIARIARFAPETDIGWAAVGDQLEQSYDGRGVNCLETFDEGAGPRLFAGGTIAFDWLPEDSVSLLRLGNPVGDLDCNGYVGLNDLALLLVNFSGSGEGDLDGDGRVLLNDLALMLSKFGHTCW